jgi:hypothetical protein
MPPKVLIENVKHKRFLDEFRRFMKSEQAENHLLFLIDKSGNEERYNKFLKDGAALEVKFKLPDKVKLTLTALASQKKWSAMGPGLKEARKLVAAHTNSGLLPRFMESPAGRWPTFLLATGVDGTKAQTMEALMKIFRNGRTPQDKYQAYVAMLKMTNKALLNPALRELGEQPPAPVIRLNGDASKAPR